MKHLVLIGSQAAHTHFRNFRRPKDLDYAGRERIMQSGCEVFSSNGMNWILENSPRVATPDILYTLKLSHMFWKINWPKHSRDIVFFQENGCKCIDELFQICYKDWIEIHGKKRAKLTQSNEEFFNPAVDRKYVHDSLHVAVAYYDRPLFEKIKPDLNSAFCSYGLFSSLSFEDRLKCCREEIYVTALERFIVPAKNHIDTKSLIAYRKAICQLVTSMSKGWFPRFIMDNLYLLWSPDKDFVKDFEIGLKKGVVHEQNV
jgi:hypothetical protein